MNFCRTVLTFALLLVFHPSPGWAEDAAELPLLADRIVAGDTAYEVIAVPVGKLGERRSGVPSAYRFPEGQPVGQLDASLQYWVEGDEFLRSLDGRFAIPFEGSAPFVGYCDLTKKKFVTFENAFPPTGEERGDTESLTRYEWTGLLDERQAQLRLFVRRWDRAGQAYSSHRASIPLADPASIRVDAMPQVVVVRVFARTGNEILCEIVDGRRRNWARVSTDTWAVQAKGRPAIENDHIGPVAYSPEKREIYAVCASGGLVIFDAKSGERKADFRGVGRFANAFTLGATFDPGGSTAVVSTPYRHRVSLIDVQTRRIVSEYRTASPLAGVVFDKKARKVYAQTTFLPYE